MYIYIYIQISFFSTGSKFNCFHCVAVCCSVYCCPLIPHHRQQIQLLSECCSVLQGVAVYCRMLQCLKWCTVAHFFYTTGSKFNCFQSVAVYYRVLQCIAGCCSVLNGALSPLSFIPQAANSIAFSATLREMTEHLAAAAEAVRLSQKVISLQVGRFTIGWLRLLGSFKSLVSFAKEPYKRDYILHKRLIL